MVDLENENGPEDSVDIEPEQPVKRHWATERADLQRQLHEAQTALELAQSQVSNMKATNSVSQGLAASVIQNWPGVDYTLPYIFVKMSVKDATGNKVPANGEFSRNSRDETGQIFTFRQGICVTNSIKEIRFMLSARSGWVSKQYQPQGN